MTYSIPLPSDETNASTSDDSIPQSPTDSTEVDDGAELRRETRAPSNDAADPEPADPAPADPASTRTDRPVPFVAPVGVVAPGTAGTAGAVPAAVIPDETTDDVPPAGADSPLRVAHESEDDWEDQFVKDPEAAKEATRERMEEQFEREHEERQREAGGSADPSAAASVDRDPEGRHAVAEQPVTEQPVTEQPVADGLTPPSAYQVDGVPVDRPGTTAP